MWRAILGAVVALAGCDVTTDEIALDETQGAESPAAQEEAQLAPRAERRFVGALEPLNDSRVTGTVTVDVDGDELTVAVDAEGLAPNVTHRQMIHVGARCPDPTADENGDGFVSVTEGLSAYQKVLIPLDDRLASLTEGEYPQADANGALRYRQTASLGALTKALRTPDPAPGDPMARLEEGEALSLEERSVVLHGVEPTRALPDSVGSIPGVAPHESLPVACAPLEPARAPRAAAAGPRG